MPGAAVAGAARRRGRADVGARHRRAHGAPPALPRADPAGPEGRRPGALQARRRRRLRPRPAARRRSGCPTSSSAVDGPITPRRLRRAPPGRRLRPRGPVRAAGHLGTSSASRCASQLDGYTLADVASTARGERRLARSRAALDLGATCLATGRRRVSTTQVRPSDRAWPGRRAAATSNRTRSLATGWSKASAAACSNGRSAVEPGRGRRRSGRRPPPGGRWRRGAPGSGGCGRSRAGTRSSATSGAVHDALAPRSACAPAARRPTPPSGWGLAPTARSARRSTPPARLGHAPHQRQVLAGSTGARRQLAHQRVVGGVGAGHDEQAGGAVVEAVHDARAARGRADAGRAPGSGPGARSPACPSRLPAPGCTTSPAGLSTTITSSSAWTTGTSTDSSGSAPAGAAATARRSTSSIWPSRTRCLPPITTSPSTLHRAARRSARRPRPG